MKFPDMDQNHSSLHRHPETSREVVEVETLLILLKNIFDILLKLGDPVSRWMFSVPDPSNEFYSSICDWGNEFFIFFGNTTSFALSLFAWISDASIFSSSSMSATLKSPFEIPSAYRAYPRNNPGNTFYPN